MHSKLDGAWKHDETSGVNGRDELRGAVMVAPMEQSSLSRAEIENVDVEAAAGAAARLVTNAVSAREALDTRTTLVGPRSSISRGLLNSGGSSRTNLLRTRGSSMSAEVGAEIGSGGAQQSSPTRASLRLSRGSSLSTEVDVEERPPSPFSRAMASPPLPTDSSSTDNTLQFDYFLSHKKSHSTDGQVPAHIAKNIHDSLELLGFKGWMDIDNLSVINEAEIRKGVEKCASMIVLLNDETWQSEWCQFEWAVAEELKLPVKVILDMERSSKANSIKKIQEIKPYLLSHQWAEYTDRHRRDCLTELAEFMDEEQGRALQQLEEESAAVSNKRRRSTGLFLRKKSNVSPISFDGFAEEEEDSHNLHPYFTMLSRLAGIPVGNAFHIIGFDYERAWQHYIRFISSLYAIVVGVQLVFPIGPLRYERHRHVHLAHFAMVLWMMYFSARVPRICRSADGMRIIFAEGQTCAEQLYSESKAIAIRAGVSVIPVCAVALVSLPWVYFDPYFIDSSDVWLRVFGIFCGTTSLMAIPPMSLAMCVAFTQCDLLLSMACVQLVASFDSLHPKIETLGLQRFVARAGAGAEAVRLDVTNEHLADFHQRWNSGLLAYQSAQHLLAPVHTAHFCTVVVGLPLPLSLLTGGFKLSENAIVPQNSISAAVVYATVIWTSIVCLKTLLLNFLAVQRLVETTRFLVFEEPLHCLVIGELCRASPVSCRYSGIIMITSATFSAAITIMVFSATPIWFMF